MKEVWKDVRGYKGFYQVSNLGRVRSLDRVVSHKKNGTARHKGRMLRPALNSREYLTLSLHKGGEMKTAKVHRLVLKAFVPRVKGKSYCNHKDGDKGNNRVENLEWCTGSENVLHAFRVGLRKKSPLSGTPPKPVKCVKTRRRFKSMNDAARKLGISVKEVWSSAHENRTVYGKYKFKEAK